MDRFRIAVFASGTGTNFQALVDAVAAGKLDVTIELLVCDKPNARVIERAVAAQVPTFVFRPREYASREAYETEIVAKLQAAQVDLIVFAGYMRIITDALLAPYANRIINVHPSLLPAFTGLRAMEQALEHGVKAAGITVHVVDGGLDSGPIVAQAVVAVEENETVDTLAAKLHPLEHQLLPQVVQLFREGRVRIDGRRALIAADAWQQ